LGRGIARFGVAAVVQGRGYREIDYPTPDWKSLAREEPVFPARQYQAHLFTDRKLDAISVAQQLSDLRFFFRKTLKQPEVVEDLLNPKRPTRLPHVLSGLWRSRSIAVERVKS